MNIIIPMAGKGQRFIDAGYSIPKPLVKINGIPMIKLVVSKLNLPGNYLFICRKEHYEKYSLQKLLNEIKHDCKIIITDKITQGAASSVLLAKENIDNDEELVIADSDQIVDWNQREFLSNVREKNVDGAIVTFTSHDPKWSFVRVDEKGFAIEVAEKKVISEHASAGIYFFRKGSYFVEAAEEMISKNLKINNEFFVAPVYNELIKKGKKIISYPINKSHSFGTPEDLQKFMKFS